MNISRFAQRETPFYYYNLPLLRQTLEAITAATADTPHFHVHYALKACVAPEVCAQFHSTVLALTASVVAK